MESLRVRISDFFFILRARSQVVVSTHRKDDRKKTHFRLPTWFCRAAYCLTAVNPTMSVAKNEYTGIDAVRFLKNHGHGDPHLPKQVYRTLFYFARLKPRLLFVIGACLRALQQTTALQVVFDPKMGVGAGLNLLALLTHSQWPAPLFLGWASSKICWLALQAEPPPHKLHVPVTVVGIGTR